MNSTYSTSVAPALISAHAIQRGQQRGIKHSDREIVFNYGDKEVPAGEGLYHLSISNRQMKFLLDRRIIAPTQAERCSRLILVTDGLCIVTNYRASRTH